LLTLALPGGLYVYQGEELGLWEVLDIPDELRQDPVWARTNGADPGRDGCRVPIPWSGSEAPFGFGSGGAWLPQPPEWRDHTAEAEAADPASMLSLYRDGLRIREKHAALGAGGLTWLDLGEGVLAFTREPGFTFVLNFSAAPIPLPDGEVLLASESVADELPTDTAVWLRH
jgi:alpha-glucosidase